MSTISSLKCGLFAAAAGLLTASASAQLIDYGPITSSRQGWYSDSGDASANFGNDADPLYPYQVGNFDTQTLRNFFIFERPNLANALFQTATLDIFLPGQSGASYLSADPSDVGAVFSLYQFSGDLGALKDGSDAAGSFAALAPSGSLFGSVTVSESTNAGVLLSIELNSFFIDYLNSVSGEFAFAGGLANADASPLTDELLFWNSELVRDEQGGLHFPQLRLQFVAVPEPSTYGLIGAAALGLLVWRRRAVKAVRKS
jgi:hypothetical protein